MRKQFAISEFAFQVTNRFHRTFIGRMEVVSMGCFLDGELLIIIFIQNVESIDIITYNG